MNVCNCDVVRWCKCVYLFEVIFEMIIVFLDLMLLRFVYRGL